MWVLSVIATHKKQSRANDYAIRQLFSFKLTNSLVLAEIQLRLSSPYKKTQKPERLRSNDEENRRRGAKHPPHDKFAARALMSHFIAMRTDCGFSDTKVFSISLRPHEPLTFIFPRMVSGAKMIFFSCLRTFFLRVFLFFFFVAELYWISESFIERIPSQSQAFQFSCFFHSLRSRLEFNSEIEQRNPTSGFNFGAIFSSPLPIMELFSLLVCHRVMGEKIFDF